MMIIFCMNGIGHVSVGSLFVFEVSLRLSYMKILKCWSVQVDHINEGSLNQLA